MRTLGTMFCWCCTLSSLCRYKQLQPDYSQYQARVLYEINREGSSGVLNSSYNPDNFVIPTAARWINGLWIGSLVLALFVSLNAILAQQWIEEYNSRMEATAASNRRWAWRHMYFTEGAESWKLDLFISSLPLFLHISLLMFFAGLVIFWFPMDELVSVLLIGVAAFGVAFYFGTTFAPLIWPECPTATPLLSRIHKVWSSARRKLSIDDDDDAPDDAYDATGVDALVPMTNGPRLDAAALLWMLKVLPASGEVGIALDAIGALTTKQHQKHFSPTVSVHAPPRGKLVKPRPQLKEQQRNELYSAACVTLRAQFRQLASYGDTASSADIGRVLRTAVFIDPGKRPLNRKVLTSWMRQHGDTHDIHLLAQCLGEKPVSDTLAPLIPQIIEWNLSPSRETDEAGVPTNGPYLESTMDLILAYAVRREDPVYTAGREIYQPVVLLCSQVLALPHGAAPRPSRLVPSIALDIIQGTMRRAVVDGPPPTKEQPIDKFDPPIGAFETRALYILGYLLRHITPNVFSFSQLDESVVQLINLAYRTLLTLGGRSSVAYTLGEAQRALGLIASPNFLEQKWTPAELGSASLVFSQAVQRAAHEETQRNADETKPDDDSISDEPKPPPQEWTQELTDIQHNMLRATLAQPKQRAGSVTETEIGAVVADCVTSFPSSCEAVAKRFSLYETVNDAVTRSRIQLLTSGADHAGQAGKDGSVWSLALRASKAHRVEHRVAPLAQEMVVSLNTLRLRGWDVTEQVHEYLRPHSSPTSPSSDGLPIGGPSFDMLFRDADAGVAYDIARHVQAIYPAWWEATAQKLRTTREDDWVWDPKLRAFSVRQNFIARVESAPQCLECLAHQPISNTGELSRQLTPVPLLRDEPLSLLPSIPEAEPDPTPPPPAVPAPAPERVSTPPLPQAPVETPTPPAPDVVTNDADTRRRTRPRRPRAESDKTTYHYFFTDPAAVSGGAESIRPTLAQSPTRNKKAFRRGSGEPTDLESRGT